MIEYGKECIAYEFVYIAEVLINYLGRNVKHTVKHFNYFFRRHLFRMGRKTLKIAEHDGKFLFFFGNLKALSFGQRFTLAPDGLRDELPDEVKLYGFGYIFF